MAAVASKPEARTEVNFMVVTMTGEEKSTAVEDELEG
jgi:hypothetical protein